MDSSEILSFHPHFKPISMEDALNLKDYGHAAHCFIYAMNSSVVQKKHPCRAAVMMQVRHDGMLGFPGGMVNKNCDFISELNRELQEEINFDTEHFKIQDEDYVISHKYMNKELCVHLYQCKVTMEEFESIERRIYDAEDFGDETFGILRVPLYTMEDGIGGFPSFLRHNFIGNARDQLLAVLAYTKLMTLEELYDAVKRSEAK